MTLTQTARQDSATFWGPPIATYTRAQALEDGTLVDVSETAQEAGIIVPVAITQGLWADIHDIPPSKSWQDPEGRLWDILSVYRYTVQTKALRSGVRTNVLTFRLIMHQGRRTYYTVKAHIGPGDQGEPVLTLMRPDED